MPGITSILRQADGNRESSPLLCTCTCSIEICKFSYYIDETFNRKERTADKAFVLCFQSMGLEY